LACFGIALDRGPWSLFRKGPPVPACLRPPIQGPWLCTGLDRFEVKLAEASKLFGKKFAAGASITKSPQDVDQIEVQGDFLDKAAEFVFKQFGKEGVKKTDIYVIRNKKKEAFFDESSDEEE